MKTELVEFIPDKIEPDVIYISLKYGSSSHLCCCGCGKEVHLPFKPMWDNGWDLTLDENNVATFSPSIGNWQYPCRSHYWIEKNEAKMLEPFPLGYKHGG
jgi:hypothetical protein